MADSSKVTTSIQNSSLMQTLGLIDTTQGWEYFMYSDIPEGGKESTAAPHSKVSY